MSAVYRSIEDAVVGRILDGLEPSMSLRRLGRNIQIAAALSAAYAAGYAAALDDDRFVRGVMRRAGML